VADNMATRKLLRTARHQTAAGTIQRKSGALPSCAATWRRRGAVIKPSAAITRLIVSTGPRCGV
jgi:hypothetical protein